MLPAPLLLALQAIPTSLIALEQCTALVVGNSAYRDAPLSNPVNDATDVASAAGLPEDPPRSPVTKAGPATTCMP